MKYDAVTQGTVCYGYTAALMGQVNYLKGETVTIIFCAKLFLFLNLGGQSNNETRTL